MEGKKKPENGTYTQVPNVFFDTCNLPESAQILYLRLYRHIAYKDDHKFVGSIRKLSNLVRLSKSTVDRMVKKLEESRLIYISSEQSQDQDRDVMTITLNPQELWILNKQHYEEESVPDWDKVLPDAKVLSQIGTLCPETGQHALNLGQSNVSLGQTVPDASSNSGQVSISTENEGKEEGKNDSSIHSFTLSFDTLDKVREFAELYGDNDPAIHQELAQRIYQRYSISDDEFHDYLYHAQTASNKTKLMSDFFEKLQRMLDDTFSKR
jgi:DNA-binding MarR family transcriptional regulator